MTAEGTHSGSRLVAEGLRGLDAPARIFDRPLNGSRRATNFRSVDLSPFGLRCQGVASASHSEPRGPKGARSPRQSGSLEPGLMQSQAIYFATESS